MKSALKNDSGINEEHVNKLNFKLPIKSESLSLGKIEANPKYRTNDWRESVLQFMKTTFTEWDEKGYFKELINWWEKYYQLKNR